MMCQELSYEKLLQPTPYVGPDVTILTILSCFQSSERLGLGQLILLVNLMRSVVTGETQF